MKAQQERETLAKKREEELRKKKLQAEKERQEQFEREQIKLVEERKIEEERRQRELHKVALLEEQERLRIQRVNILERELQMYVDGKKDLRKNLINRRMEQVAAGKETAEQRINRRDELVESYQEYATRMTPVIKEYWTTRQPNKKDPFYLPMEDQINYDTTFNARQKWDEPEIMRLLFNIIELKQEPECWPMMKEIHYVIRPEERGIIDQQFSLVKNEWEQKYQSAMGWRSIAEIAIQQQVDREIISNQTQQKKIPPREQRPPVVSPDDLKTSSNEKKKVKENRERKTSPLTETRQVGKPNKLGVPSEEQMQKERAAALAAASDIARNGNNGGQRTTYVTSEPNEISRSRNPPSYHSLREKYCENCQKTHAGGLCPCPICDYDDHVYYECPLRSEKEGTKSAVSSMQVPESGPWCEICHLYHKPPCTLGLKQQANFATRRRSSRRRSHARGSRGRYILSRSHKVLHVLWRR